ncbi:DUF4054 domain-containing protein [Bradyrhizobium sp. Pear76]|uniref:DUF4054 domain-containing protein n=1 Tax=Bradyrhizobium oropedii TaxID=1571201 RepID=UPI001E541B8E|nr:DUF4054 domain-containing protein [Bradyrhizobium oropedii]MCC8963767.1 DUF4054 domain-containing protein [Bradyrhizobium oropedii]
MGVVVQFNYAQWAATYPEFGATVNQTQAQNYFQIATSIHRNDGGGPVCDPTIQLNLLNMLTAHVAALFGPPVAGAQPSTIVGRISSASEGSVSVQAAYSNNVSQQMAWFIQTKYGAMYWTAAAPFRTMRYVPSFRRGVVGPPGFGV